MDVKKIKFLTTLKTGGMVYIKNETLEAPFPSSIIQEIRANLSGEQKPETIEVMEHVGPYTGPVAEPPAPAPEIDETPEQVPAEDEKEEPQVDDTSAEIAGTALAPEQTIIDEKEAPADNVKGELSEEELAIGESQPKGPGEAGEGDPALTGEYIETEDKETPVDDKESGQEADEKPKNTAPKPKTEKKTSTSKKPPIRRK